MHVVRFHTLDALSPWTGDWDRLAHAVPFRSWAWLSTWWRHYAVGTDPRRQPRLFVLGVFDHASHLVAIAPWYLQPTASQGCSLRFLGSGQVCSDYLTVLCERSREDEVAATLAEWLCHAGTARGNPSTPDECNRWDLFHCTGVDHQDPMVGTLLDHMAQHGCTVHRRPGPNCWRIELPTGWDEYLARLSSSHRRQLRRAERLFLHTGRAVFHSVQQHTQLADAQQILVDLHQRRRQQLHEPGCFSSKLFEAFHRDVMPQLLSAGQLQLHWLDFDGHPAAVEYHLVGGGVVYAYQCGIAPDLSKVSPGEVIHLLTVRNAIQSGYRAYDFLRGDEPYKAHWRACPRPSLDVRVVPPRTSAQLRLGVWRAGSRAKQWLKTGLRLVTSSHEERPSHPCPDSQPHPDRPETSDSAVVSKP